MNLGMARGLARRIAGAVWRRVPAPPWRRYVSDATSPLQVYRRWQRLLSPLVSTERFVRAGLDNVWSRYPGKLDRQLMVLQCLSGVQRRGVEGIVAEFGCYQGHTAVQIVEAMKEAGDESAMLLFDSFAGMPVSPHPADRHWQPGALAASFEEVSRRFAHFPSVRLVPGFFADTLSALAGHTVKFAHVDADLYLSIRDVNAVLLDQMSPGGVIVYDDYGFASCEGAMQAVDEAMSGRRDFATLYLPTGQYVAIRTGER